MCVLEGISKCCYTYEDWILTNNYLEFVCKNINENPQDYICEKIEGGGRINSAVSESKIKPKLIEKFNFLGSEGREEFGDLYHINFLGSAIHPINLKLLSIENKNHSSNIGSIRNLMNWSLFQEINSLTITNLCKKICNYSNVNLLYNNYYSDYFILTIMKETGRAEFLSFLRSTNYTLDTSNGFTMNSYIRQIPIKEFDIIKQKRHHCKKFKELQEKKALPAKILSEISF
jgi:hypothetical protein